MFDIVIPTKCVGEAIGTLCTSLVRTTPPTNLHIVAVGPVKPSVDLPWIEDSGTVVTAINKAVAQTTSEYIVILHDDAVLLPQEFPGQWLAMLLAAVKKGNVAVSGPLKLDTHISFFCAIIPRRVWNDVGPLSEKFPFRGYDLDWCRRAVEKGYTLQGTCDVGLGDGIYTGNFPIYHKGGHTLDSVEVVLAKDHLFSVQRGVPNAVPVTAHISTKNRTLTTLPLAVQSIALQTVVPQRLMVFDDNPTQFFKSTVYQHLFNVLSQRGCQVDVIAGEGKGQVLNHQKALDRAETPFLWRVDDDNSAEPNVLAVLLSKMVDKVGAVAPKVHFPWAKPRPLNLAASGLLADVRARENVQWYTFSGDRQVEHLHNTFLFRKEAAGEYPQNLSVVGHREETIFTHSILRRGWSLIVTGDAVTWHLKDPQGGIRSFQDAALWESDERIFEEWATQLGVKFNEYQLVVLDSGMGDHLAFAHVWPKVKKKAADEGRKIILAVCYPEVFLNEPTISIAEASFLDSSLDKYNVYNFMIHNRWTGTLVEAYRAMFGV